MDLKEKLLKLPTTPGVYIMKNIDGNVIYVGKAKNLKRRVNQYFNRSPKEIKTGELVKNIYNFDYILTPTELDALGLESNLIKKYQPFYNILLKDGKAMPYLRIDMREDYPRVDVVRRVKKDGAKYFGPYFAGISVNELSKLIYSAYPIRNCKTNLKKPLKRECLNYSMGLCSAPCTRRIDRTEYHAIMQKVIDFLNGTDKSIVEVLTQKMNKLAEIERFEQAMVIRDRIKIVNKMQGQVITQLPMDINLDMFSFVSNGVQSCISVGVVRGGKSVGCECFIVFDNNLNLSEALSSFIAQYYKMNSLVPNLVLLPPEFEEKELVKDYLEKTFEHSVTIELPSKGVKHKLLEANKANAVEYLDKQIEEEKRKRDFTMGAVEQLKEKLNLPRLPLRMECYDISNIQGTHKVASMVVFKNGEPYKAHYRKFIIKTVEGADDFASMAEVLGRRVENINTIEDDSFNEIPDLIVIDGGKGQLSHAYASVQAFNVDIPMISLAKREEEVFMPGEHESHILDKTSYALKLLQRIRDESHRFAITFHRQKRGKLNSMLENVDGVGKLTARKLLLKFKNLDSISKLTVDELAVQGGVSKKVAENVIKYLN